MPSFLQIDLYGVPSHRVHQNPFLYFFFGPVFKIDYPFGLSCEIELLICNFIIFNSENDRSVEAGVTGSIRKSVAQLYQKN